MLPRGSSNTFIGILRVWSSLILFKDIIPNFGLSLDKIESGDDYKGSYFGSTWFVNFLWDDSFKGELLLSLETLCYFWAEFDD